MGDGCKRLRAMGNGDEGGKRGGGVDATPGAGRKISQDLAAHLAWGTENRHRVCGGESLGMLVGRGAGGQPASAEGEAPGRRYDTTSRAASRGSRSRRVGVRLRHPYRLASRYTVRPVPAVRLRVPTIPTSEDRA